MKEPDKRTRFFYGNSHMIVTRRKQTRDFMRVCFPASVCDNSTREGSNINTQCIVARKASLEALKATES